MELNLTEKFLLLALHPEKPRYIISEAALNAGLIGAILLDLTAEGKIELVQKKINVSRSHASSLSPAHKWALEKIAHARKERKAKTWISLLAQRSRRFRHLILEELSKKRLVTIEHKRFLFIPYIKASLRRKDAQKEIITDLKHILSASKLVNAEYSSLLGLVDACKMHKIMASDKAEIKKIKQQLKTVVANDTIMGDVSAVIKETQAAIAAAITTSVIVTPHH